jgi:acyl carrier protein
MSMSSHLSPEVRDHEHADIASRIADIWAELFGDDSLVVGLEDNFFSLGGSSLLAVSLVDMINRAFSLSLSLVTVVESPTLASLAAHIASLRSEPESDLEEGLL